MLAKDNPRYNCDLLANTCFAHVFASGIQNSSTQCALAPQSRDLYGTPPLSAQKGPFGPYREIRMPERPDLNPITTDWSDWVDHMVSTHFDLVLGNGHLIRVLGPTSTRVQRYQQSSALLVKARVGHAYAEYANDADYTHMRNMRMRMRIENLIHIIHM